MAWVGIGVAIGAGVAGALAVRRATRYGDSVRPWFARLANRLGLEVDGGLATGQVGGHDIRLTTRGGRELTVHLLLPDFPYTGRSANTRRQPSRHILVSLSNGASDLDRLSLHAEPLYTEWQRLGTCIQRLSVRIQTSPFGLRPALRRLAETAALLESARERPRHQRLRSMIVDRIDIELCLQIPEAVAREAPDGPLASLWREGLSDGSLEPIERVLAKMAFDIAPASVADLEELVSVRERRPGDSAAVAAAWMSVATTDRDLQLAVLKSRLPVHVREAALNQLAVSGTTDDIMFIRKHAGRRLAATVRTTVLAIQARAGHVAAGMLTMAEIEGGWLSEADETQ